MIMLLRRVQMMCGIAGWYRRKGRPVSPAIIQAQCNSILHRGPDDSGELIDGDFGFGMRRLSILDIEGGHQPMRSDDGRFAIVFNGEIYNHLDVRKLLTAAGYKFLTHSDTETILAAFTHWGNDTWPRLEGMFAVGIWDRHARKLTLARDPLGIKPLYISQQHGSLSFASELKALRILPDHRFEVSDRAVHDFLSFGHVRRPRSIFRDVDSLDPGHFLTIGPDAASEVRCFWQPRFHLREGLSLDQWSEEMRAMLRDTTARHMQSDVPVGAFLSGGIDSSAVLSTMKMAATQPIKAFTIGHPGAKVDETEASRRIALHLGCEHIVAPLEMSESIEMLPRILGCYDEPFADMAAIPTWFAAKLASREVKVVLCGEGGDELFAGYKRHRNARIVEQLRPLVGPAGLINTAIRAIPVSPSKRFNLMRQHARRFAEFVGLPDGYQQFFAATQISSRDLRQRIYSPEFWDRHESDRSYAELEQEYFSSSSAPRGSALEEFMFADLTLNLPSAMLTRLDRATMAHSLEARVPFLSHKMVEWALTVPEGMKLKGGTGKLILRRAISPWIPTDILARPKQGFQIPIADWLRDRFGDFAREVWSSSGLSRAGYLNPAAVELLFLEHKEGAADHSRLLYAITAFGIWWHGEQSAFAV
jgi:asparagine synthase (glutamine-hydrolysing)